VINANAEKDCTNFARFTPCERGPRIQMLAQMLARPIAGKILFRFIGFLCNTTVLPSFRFLLAQAIKMLAHVGADTERKEKIPEIRDSLVYAT